MSSFNQGQQKVFLRVIDFINDPLEQFMDISGGAGTGKTWLISKIADTILQHANADSTLTSVAVTATTNKAAAVISEAMPHREISTIYSFMNLRLSENYSTGEVKVVPVNGKWHIHSNTLIIVDEDSMTNTPLFNWIMKGIDSTCKVLFVGDRNQLAPVKETLSPIFTQEYPTAYLTESVRNAGQPALMDLCEQVKQTVLTGVFTPITEVPGVIDFVDGTTMQGILEREFRDEDPGKCVLCYTNKRVIQYNNFIRGVRGYTQPFEVGEMVSNNKSAELPGKIRLYTDQRLVVSNITSTQTNDKIVPGHDIDTITLELFDPMTTASYTATVFADNDDRTAVLDHYKARKNWGAFYKLQAQYPDLRPVAASTTHKAQGTTFDSVVVDLADIGKCTNSDQTARMQYVALSRPRNRLFIRGALPDRYFK